MQYRDHRLTGLLGRHPLDGERHDLAGPLLAFVLRLVLDVPDDERGFPLGLVLDGGDELGLGSLGGEPGDALEFLAALGVLPVQLGGLAVEVLPTLVQGLRAVFDPLQLLVKPLFAVGEAGFAALKVTTQLAHLVLDRPDFLFNLAAALRGLFGFGAGPLQDAGGLGLGAGPDELSFLGDLVELAAVGLG